MPDPEPAPPAAGSSTIAGIRNYLTGGKLAPARDRDLGAYIQDRVPRPEIPVLAALEFHRRAARWAVTAAPVPAASVLFASAGLPAPGIPLHAGAARACPSARFAYADPDPVITVLSRPALAEPGSVSVMTAPAAYPASLLRTPEAAELLALGPVSVHILGAVHYWTARAAREAVAGYGKLLPSGSSLCLTWGLCDATPEGEELAEIIAMAGGPVYRHLPAEVARWMRGAGLRLHGQGIGDAGAFAAPYAGPSGPRAPMRVMEAVAIVP